MKKSSKKQKIESKRKIKEMTLGISKQIDINFRNYALYVLEHRGIPSFYDGLTNVQRFSLMNASKMYSKTLSLVGNCISSGYHHGDASLQKAINKLAKPFGCSEQLLLGDGFFGSPVNSNASSSRYTSIKINPIVDEIIDEYRVLDHRNDDNQWEYLRMDVPMGMLTMVIGIAVGYKSTMLPRKLEDMKNFLDGKKTSLSPYFKGFHGKIEKYNDSSKIWIIEGVSEIDDDKRTIRIIELPPIMKYSSFIKKIGKISDGNLDFSMVNNSSDDVDILLKFKGGCSWSEFKEKIGKINKLIVTENMIFVKDSTVIEYSSIEDYLTEFRVHRAEVRLEKKEYDIGVDSDELLFLKSKLEYLKFMIAKKRTNEEIEEFLSKYESKVKSRLERIFLKELSPDNVIKTKNEISDLEKKLKMEKDEEIELKNVVERLRLEIPITAKKTFHSVSMDLFVDSGDEIDGIEIYDPNDDVEDDDVKDDDDENNQKD